MIHEQRGPFGLQRVVAFWLAAASCSSVGIAAASEEWSDVVDENKAAVVVVETNRALGSGFLVRSNGMLVTNKHVIDGATEITVSLASGEKFHKALVLAEDDDRDLAILRIEGSGLPFLSLANSSEAKIAQDVLLIGAPRGLSHTVSSGMVSAIRLMENGTKVIQTTAPASPGSSGGPLMTRDGNVIGVLTFQYSSGQNLNFAIPSNYVQGMIETLESTSPVSPIRTLSKLHTATAGPPSLGGRPTDVAPIRLDGVLFVAVRTQGHRQFSKPEFFQGAVDDLLFFLKEHRVQLANDALGEALQFDGTISIYQATLAAKKAGASHVLVLTVDRPIMAWVKLRLQCLTADGKSLWELETQDKSWTKGTSTGTSSASRKLRELVSKRLKQNPLPTAAEPTDRK